jgi:hypothetical protein
MCRLQRTYQDRSGEEKRRSQEVEDDEEVVTTREAFDRFPVQATYTRAWNISLEMTATIEAVLPTMPATTDMQNRDMALYKVLVPVASPGLQWLAMSPLLMS